MMKKWMVCVLSLVFLFSMAGCGSPSKTAEAAGEMITLTLTPQYARGITDEWLDANIGTDYQSFDRQPDGSVVLNMTTEQYTNYIDTIRLGMISAIQNMAASDHNNITDISFNDDFSEFQVTVNTDTLHRSDADSAYYLVTAYGGLYQSLTTGSEDCSVVVTYLDAGGNVLEQDYRPESGG